MPKNCIKSDPDIILLIQLLKSITSFGTVRFSRENTLLMNRVATNPMLVRVATAKLTHTCS
jgi:hypothetical protein